MPILSADVVYAVEKLLEIGVLNEASLERIASLFRGLEALTGAVQEGPSMVKSAAPLSGRGLTVKDAAAIRAEEAGEIVNLVFPGEARPGEEALAPIRGGHEEAPPRKRAPRGSFNMSKLELQNLRDGGMTVKMIAELRGVSPGTVQNKLREYGLTNPRG